MIKFSWWCKDRRLKLKKLFYGIIAAQTISGMAHSGIDSIPREGTWLLDKGKRVVDARTNADLKDFLQTSNKSGGNITVNVPVNIGDSGLSDEEGKQLGKNIKEAIRLQIQHEQRPGGLLNKRWFNGLNFILLPKK